jgi:NAD(P)-dependent dehydrogenase (short-subunit alcohol dehydrogenase family)
MNSWLRKDQTLMIVESSKSVLVTGASSGIGNATVVYLAKQGYIVLAGVRKDSDVQALNDIGLNNLKPIFPLDLTKTDQILAATSHIKEQVRTNQIPALHAIINIAGGGSLSPIELLDISDFRQELEKRIVAPVIMLQELLPLLRETKGRILWIATPALFPIPFVADIHAPDFAVNYLARTLNLELFPDGIRNILIRCGGIKTPSVERSEKELAARLGNMSKEKSAIYKSRLEKVLKDQEKFDSKRTEPTEVAKLIAKVLMVKKPKTRYQIGHMSKLGAFLEKLPQSWVDSILMVRFI